MAQTAEQKRAYHKAYREANKEKLIATQKAWREANKERITATGKAWYEANKERRAATSKAHYEANKENVSATHKAWYEANKERKMACVKKSKTKRERLVAEGPIDDGITPRSVAERDNMVCAECQGIVKPHPGGYLADGWTIGHIVPLSKGGTHTWDNVQCECHSCNTSKGANQ